MFWLINIRKNWRKGVNKNVALHTISLCSGGCGIELGLRLTGEEFRTVCYVEIEAFASANLVKKIEDGCLDDAPIWSDLTTFDGKAWRGKVDLLTAGFPCQPVSVAGRRRAQDDPRWLWPYIKGLLVEIQPTYVFLENVPGLLIRGFGDILGDLAEIGFNAEWDVFSAKEVGAPHLRKRVFILAYSNSRDVETHRTTRSSTETFRPGQDKSSKKSESERDLANTYSSNAPSCTLLRRSNAENDKQKQREIPFQEPTSSSERERDLENTDGDRRSETYNRKPTKVNKRGEKSRRKGQPDTNYFRCTSQTIRDNWWTVEPNVGRLAHGVADRVERLTLCGNGVVPQVACKAWVELNKRLDF
jgi:DNA (cytosine-5)-methyltransferase 1